MLEIFLFWPFHPVRSVFLFSAHRTKCLFPIDDLDALLLLFNLVGEQRLHDCTWQTDTTHVSLDSVFVCVILLPAVLLGPSPATSCRGCWRTCSSAGPSGRRAASQCRPCGCCSGPPGSWQLPSCGACPAKPPWSRRWCCRWTDGPHGPRQQPGCGNPAGTPHLQQRSWDPFSSLDLKSGEGQSETPGQSRVTGTVQTVGGWLKILYVVI